MDNKEKTRYYLFIDECGDHNLDNYDPTFPIFTLCGILVSQKALNSLIKEFKQLKNDVFGTDTIVIHSSDIRKRRKAFSALNDDGLRVKFLAGIEQILNRHGEYVIVSCTILKAQLIKFCVRGEEADVYGLCLSYLIERGIFCVDNKENGNGRISIVVERRGKKEDKQLLNYYNGLRNRGTKWVKPERLRDRIADFSFSYKKDNIIGLQIADLVAYPITRHILYPERPNRSYETIMDNVFSDNGVLLGQKVIPH